MDIQITRAIKFSRNKFVQYFLDQHRLCLLEGPRILVSIAELRQGVRLHELPESQGLNVGVSAVIQGLLQVRPAIRAVVLVEP